MPKVFSGIWRLIESLAANPGAFVQTENTVASITSGYDFSRNYVDKVPHAVGPPESAASPNPLWEYFQNHHQGPGIFKWEHYFDIYHRHLSRFVGRHVDVMEIGIFGGGSLAMWRAYLGENSRIYGVDINPACQAYENEHTSIFIGDQESRDFWKVVKQRVPSVDILIDDGGHSPEQQQVTLEEMLPVVRPGGI